MRRIIFPALILANLIWSHANAQYVNVGQGNYRTTLIPNGFCSEVWEGPATSFDGGTPASPLVTSNLSGRPVPTNDWWTSLLWPTGDPVNNYSSPLHAYPLILQATGNGLLVGHYDSSTAFEGRINFNDSLLVGLSGLSASETRAHDYSDFTVTADWNNGQLRSTFGHGLPFVYFERLTNQDATISLNGSSSVVSNSNNIVLVQVDGGYYGFFAPTGSTWNQSGSTFSSSLNGQDYFSVATIPASNNTEALNLLPDFTARAFSFVTEGTADYSYDESASEVTTTFSVMIDQKETGAGILNETYLTLMPHHWRYSPTATTGLQFDNAYGPMETVSGTSFQTVHPYNGVLPTLPRVAESSSGFNESTLRNNLQELSNFTPPLLDTYFGGKDINKLMQAALIAEQYGETELVEHHVTMAQSVLEDWFTTDNNEQNTVLSCGRVRALYYDDTWGTIIGFPASFGSNTYLNDHHFHYGYWIMTAAMIARFDSDWVQTSNWGGMVDLMIRDVASGDRNDPMFPYMRAFDAYAGHGWAGGPGDSFSGNNQESSSEAINCWAAMIHWGEETGDQAIRDRGIYLYTTAVAAVEEYWFDTHEQIFSRIDYNQEVTGIHFGDGVAYATFFNGEEEAILGIQNIPVTGSTLYWGKYPDEVLEVFNNMVAQNDAKGGPGAPFDLFQDLLWSYLATSDPDRAIQLFNNAGNYGVEGGESRAHTYHWLHGHAYLGQLDRTITANKPTYAVFDQSGTKTYIASNSDDTQDTITYSDGTSFRVPANQMIAVRRPMAVTITAPTQGEIVTTNEPVTIEALVDHLDALNINQVEFFINGSPIGVDATEPYQFSYTPTTEGTFEVTATATDINAATISTQAVRFISDIGQLPFGGTPTLIEANSTTRIEAENFDVGDPGEAYFDVTANNEGNAYRTTEGVDIEATTDAGGGFNVGFMAAGEFMEYTVEVEQGGLYDLEMRVAALDAGPAYRMEIDGTDVSGTMNVPDTNGFQNWTTIQAPQQIPLTTGQQVLRISTITGLGNINWFELTGPENSVVGDWWILD